MKANFSTTLRTCAVGLLLAITGSVQAVPVTTTFNISTADIGTSSDSDFFIQANATNTLVNSGVLIAGNPTTSTGGLPDRRTYLEFDLTGLLANSTVTNAKLRLFQDVTSTDTFGGTEVFQRTAAFVPGGSSDYAELGGTLLGSLTPNPASAAYRELDVTAAVESWRASGLANHFGFALRGIEGFTLTGQQFQSSTGANVPQLVVTQNPAIVIPEPATATLGLLAVGGLVLRRRRMA